MANDSTLLPLPVSELSDRLVERLHDSAVVVRGPWIGGRRSTALPAANSEGEQREQDQSKDHGHGLPHTTPASFQLAYRERWRRICVNCGEPFGAHGYTEALVCAGEW
jgi:hypothetical protein